MKSCYIPILTSGTWASIPEIKRMGDRFFTIARFRISLTTQCLNPPLFLVATVGDMPPVMMITQWTHCSYFSWCKPSMTSIRTLKDCISAPIVNCIPAPSQLQPQLTVIGGVAPPLIGRKPSQNFHTWLEWVLHLLLAPTLSLCRLYPQMAVVNL